jgi:outer membrane protein assembly factor BamB
MDRMRLPLLTALLTIALYAEDWTRFRGPNGSGIAGGTGFPVEFGSSQNLVWKSPARSGKSSPVLTARHVFLTAFDQEKLYTQCFDRKTGKLLWERFETRQRSEFRNQRNEPAAISPVTDGENVYSFFGDFGLISYDPAGKVRWKAPLGPFTNMMGMSSSPILAGSYLIIVADQDESYIAAFDPRNGEIRWKSARTERDGWASPVLFEPPGGKAEIITASRGQLGAHRVGDGSRVWTKDDLSPAIVASPIVAGDVVYTFGYGHDEPTPWAKQLDRYDKNHDGQISADEYGNDGLMRGIALHEGNRDGIVQRGEWEAKQREVLKPSVLMAVKLHPSPRELWRYEKSFFGVVPSPLLYNGLLYVIRNGGILATFDPATGKPGKTGRVAGALGAYSASPVAADGKLYLANEEGKVAVVRAGPDWDVLAVNDVGEGCFATPALAGGMIYVRTADTLFSFGGARK